jgi:hypothetical protein
MQIRNKAVERQVSEVFALQNPSGRSFGRDKAVHKYGNLRDDDVAIANVDLGLC